MELPESYEALYRRASEAVARGDLDEAITRMKRLADRLMSLPPHILERKEDLRDLLDDAVNDYLVFLRWDGRHEEALAEIERLEPRLPRLRASFATERALNTIDRGNVSEGLDMLRALIVQNARTEREIRRLLALELWGAGQYAEAKQIAAGLLRDALDNQEAMLALDILLDIAIDANDLKGVMRCPAEIEKRSYETHYRLYEWLAGRRYWAELERQLRGLTSYDARQLFLAEIRRARGDEDGARKMWQAILDEADEGDDPYAAVCAALFLGQPSEETAGDLRDVLEHTPADSSALLALVAALVQMGRIDEAVKAIQWYQQFTRLARPYYRILPYSYWLRLRRYPMPDEAVEVLRPYFVTEETASPA